ncbi:glycosyltransferase family 4 protein [Mycobacterium sp. CBMA293]|uniref:glycosyltransferase n=1 Tax=unclassified Mycolicibacterium TaxID=2636767 RepID=UPI0012DEC045|nr:MULTISPECIES: glycosyltransferase family 4 protein [unclassified Mycolicibacterium]MUL46798.1 glycosyltransferase family 4 protein [Mycolicibacterium sp. CBMA 360]MUL57417.1 glycosyltransferase family 4 protein [Mycolicibacterium sp. CBMA 335]MUL70457.1 glycosyltransferase family 4 protein [Mycolicibacterium sp. CBMA 311]MUL92505.1 glycosyltransferase family 4 protein [Mycolicibacterium sp. CBMA 230]MUM04880.1 glycosyl transferase [Mycolicibacterium sp. CBMA 213]
MTAPRPKVAFILSKDPVLEHTGDIALARMLMELAADTFDVSAIALSPEPGTVTADLISGGLPLERVHKPAIRPHRLLIDSLRLRRSLVHIRFDTDELVRAIDRSAADVFVAEHSYMAESFFRSKYFGHKRLVVNTNVSESLVWRASRGALGRVEEPRLIRDELRVARAADGIGTYDAEEAQYYRDNGVRDARFMDITMPPGEQVDVAKSPPRLVFMGTRDWPPNQEGFLRALQLWPRISAGIDGAELCVIGAKKPGAADPVYPSGVRDLGFVDDLGAFLGTCRALMAPISTGGGVRVKLLDTFRIGLPSVATSAAIGSLGPIFGIQPLDDDAAFIAECRRLLTDVSAAADLGNQLYAINRQRWQDRTPHRAVADLLRGAEADQFG